jgi:hypothetical protein
MKDVTVYSIPAWVLHQDAGSSPHHDLAGDDAGKSPCDHGHSPCCRLEGDRMGFSTAHPLRASHHAISAVGLIGGGQVPTPGEVSRAHPGVLCLDELPECRRHVLEVLRQPLEEGVLVEPPHGRHRSLRAGHAGGPADALKTVAIGRSTHPWCMRKIGRFAPLRRQSSLRPAPCSRAEMNVLRGNGRSDVLAGGIERQGESSSGVKVSYAARREPEGIRGEPEMWQTWNASPTWWHHAI